MRIEGSDALDYEEASRVAYELMDSGDKFGFLILCGINFGLRVSDLLGVTYDQLKSGEFVIKEKKRGKKRKVVVNDDVMDGLAYMEELDAVRYQLGGSAFVSQKGTVYSPQCVNRKLKKVFPKKNMKITSHSMRKAFGKRLYDVTGQNLAKVQLALRHSDPEHTLRYIGITQDEMDECYNLIV